MTMYTYDVSLVVDPTAGTVVPAGTIGTFRASVGGPAVTTYDLQGNPNTLVTNALGIVASFTVADHTWGYLDFGLVSIPVWSNEARDALSQALAAQASAAAAQTSAQVSADSAQTAAAVASQAQQDVAAAVAGLPAQMGTIVGSMIVAGTGITTTYDPVTQTVTITATGGGGGGVDEAAVKTIIGSSVVAGPNITVAPGAGGTTVVSGATAPVVSVQGKTGAVNLTKTDIGLSAVDNTADSAKPLSTAATSALALKANLNGATFTGQVSVPAGTAPGHAVNRGQLSTVALTGLASDVNGFAGGTQSIPMTKAGTASVAVGTARWYNETATALTILSVRASAGTAPTGAAVIVDVNVNGTTIYGTQANRPTIPAASTTSGKATGHSVTSIPAGGYLTVDIDQVGSTVAGADIVVQVEVTPGVVSVAGGGGGGGIFTTPRLGAVRVASNALPADVKAQCDFVCDGVDDQAQINAALALATRPGDGFGGEGYGTVRLVGPSFSIADDNATPILGHPNTILEGGGAGTLVSPKWTSTTVDRGCIELVTQGTTRFKVYNLTIGHAAADSSKFNGHGIKFQGNGTGGTYELPTGADAYLQVQDVNIHYPRGHGVYTLGTAGDPSGCRGFRAKSVSVRGASNSTATGDGFRIDSSDAKLMDCTCADVLVGFRIMGGSQKITHCKTFYTVGDGFSVESSLAELSACAAQDCGRWGFNFATSNYTAHGISADSCARRDQTGGGVLVAAWGSIFGVHCSDRAQTPASLQNRGIMFSGSPQVYIDGYVEAPTDRTNFVDWVVGSPGAGSYGRIVRNGTTVWAVG